MKRKKERRLTQLHKTQRTDFSGLAAWQPQEVNLDLSNIVDMQTLMNNKVKKDLQYFTMNLFELPECFCPILTSGSHLRKV